MKTAMQELKDDIIIEKKLGFITENSCNRILDYIDNLYFKKEKEQIVKAHGTIGWYKPSDKTSGTTTGEEYYNQTYNQNK
jgi:hypothetical protein